MAQLARTLPHRPPLYLAGVLAALAVAAIPLGTLLAQETAAPFVSDWSGDRVALGDNALGPDLKHFEER